MSVRYPFSLQHIKQHVSTCTSGWLKGLSFSSSTSRYSLAHASACIPNNPSRIDSRLVRDLREYLQQYCRSMSLPCVITSRRERQQAQASSLSHLKTASDILPHWEGGCALVRGWIGLHVRLSPRPAGDVRRRREDHATVFFACSRRLLCCRNAHRRFDRPPRD